MLLRNRKSKRQAIFPKNILPQSFQEGARGCQSDRESGKVVTDCRSGQFGPKLQGAGPGRTAGQGSLSSADRAPFDGEPDSGWGVC